MNSCKVFDTIVEPSHTYKTIDPPCCSSAGLGIVMPDVEYGIGAVDGVVTIVKVLIVGVVVVIVETVVACTPLVVTVVDVGSKLDVVS